jgi:hypothetical protein
VLSSGVRKAELLDSRLDAGFPEYAAAAFATGTGAGFEGEDLAALSR